MIHTIYLKFNKEVSQNQTVNHKFMTLILFRVRFDVNELLLYGLLGSNVCFIVKVNDTAYFHPVPKLRYIYRQDKKG